jgi:threonine dehydratase
VGRPGGRRAPRGDPARRHRGVLRLTTLPTPLERAPSALAAYAGRQEIWLKREDIHQTGSFKWRAALPVVERYAAAHHESLVTSSTGNHGAAVAWACRQLDLTAIVFVPTASNPRKLRLLRGFGADVRVAADDLDGAKDAARSYAAGAGLPFFEDGAEPLQYEAYEAIGNEVLDQASPVPVAIVTPIGNGALAGGVGAAVGRRAPKVLRIGVVAEEMPVMAASYDAGRAVDVPAGTTIADGLAVRVAIPFAVERLRDTVDLVLRVSEREIAAALVVCHDTGVLVEPSAGAALAAVHQSPSVMPEGPVVLVMTGSNVHEAVVAAARDDSRSTPG